MEEGCQASQHGKFVAKSASFQRSLNDIFDISHCQCKEFSLCNCAKEKRVPRAKQEFLKDQQNNRKMYIGGVDKKTEKTKKRKLSREDRMEIRREKKKVSWKVKSLSHFLNLHLKEQSPLLRAGTKKKAMTMKCRQMTET